MRLMGQILGRTLAGLAVALAFTLPSLGEDLAKADVVVLVDTSTSMREDGMDPERTSLLVAKLLADIVPGELAVVRLLDLYADRDVLPRRPTGEKQPCAEDPNKICDMVEPASDWEEEARSNTLGALIRPQRGDADFKKQLEGHLLQRSNNSFFNYSFRAAEGIFASRPGSESPKSVLWLSDGRSDDEAGVHQAISDLRGAGVAVEAIVFGKGDPRLAQDAGLVVRQVEGPRQLMKAFAGAFRRIVHAPFEIDNLVAAQPRFEMKANVEEAWVVVYDDQDLDGVALTSPSGAAHGVDFAADRWPSAGAYQVAYLRRPEEGTWTVKAGTAGAAYAVVQRSILAPALLGPETALVGTPSVLEAGVRAGLEGDLLTDREVLESVTLTAEIEGQTYALSDRGDSADETAGDGRFVAPVTFRGSGEIPVRLRLQSPVVDRWIEASVRVTGHFRALEESVQVDLGNLQAGEESCRQLPLPADHQGEVPLTLRRTKRLPSGHELFLKAGDEPWFPGDSRGVSPGQPLEVCLRGDERAPSSQGGGEPWLVLQVSGSDRADHKISYRLAWELRGLTFLERWGWLLLSLLALLALVFLILGFVLPQRFSGTLALVFVPERDDLDEQQPMAVLQWPGVGIGFYRNARAYLLSDFRLSGKGRGALAVLTAEKGGARVAGAGGQALFRETLDGAWESVSPEGRRIRQGEVYRVGERGPFFRVANRGRRP